MSLTGWIFLLLALGLILGSLFMLRDSSMHIPEDKKEKIRQRQAEQEARDREEEDRES